MKESRLEMHKFKIIEHKVIAHEIYQITFEKPETVKIIPGQFAMLYLNDSDFFLGRPFSFSQILPNSFSIIYKVLGKGTKKMTELKQGDSVAMRLPLGQGFTLQKKSQKILIYAGGLGLAPLLSILDDSVSKDITFVIGFKNKSSVYGLERLEKYKSIIFTDDGSYGLKGNITHADIDPFDYDVVYACGPQPMLQYLMKILRHHPLAYLSLEERMACGTGVCMGCVCGKDNRKRVCLDGPVFSVKELI